MHTSLTFKDQAITTYDNSDSKIWFTMDQLAKLLGYANAGKVSNIYNRHKDEFTDSMTTLTKVRMDGINNSLREVDVRLFSPRLRASGWEESKTEHAGSDIALIAVNLNRGGRIRVQYRVLY